MILLYWWFTVRYKYPQTSAFWRKNETHFTLNFVQNSTSLLTAFKNNWKLLENAMTNQRLKNVRCASFRFWCWQGNYNRILDGRKNCECYVSTKTQETDIVFS